MFINFVVVYSYVVASHTELPAVVIDGMGYDEQDQLIDQLTDYSV